MKMELTHASAEELRTLARNMYGALEEISRETENLYRNYQNLQDDVGPHADQFLAMLNNVKSAKSKMGDVMGPLRDKMVSTAEKIDDFVNRSIG